MNLSTYYEEIMKEPLLSKEEELDLFLEMQDPTYSAEVRKGFRDKIIRANLRFVFKEAKKYSRNDLSLFEDLISAGNEGLIVALEKYEPKTGNKFLTYAGWWVKQRILKHMASQRIVSLPIWRQQLSSRIQRVLDSQPDITFDELKKAFPEEQEKDLRELFQTKFLTFYIEDIGDDSSFEVNPIEDEVDAKLDRERLHEVIGQLPDQHRQVIESSFGILDGEDRKISDVAKELGLSRTQVKELKREALLILKNKLGDFNPFS